MAQNRKLVPKIQKIKHLYNSMKLKLELFGIKISEDMKDLGE